MKRLTLAVVIVLSIALLMAGAVAAHPGLGKFKDVDRATAHGYVTDDHCVPGMGIHYANFGLIDDEVVTSQPEVLVYAHGDNGLELVAVEYVATEEFQLLGDHAHFHPHLGAYALHT